MWKNDYDAILFYKYAQSMNELYEKIEIKNYTRGMGNKEKSLNTNVTLSVNTNLSLEFKLQIIKIIEFNFRKHSKWMFSFNQIYK